jgi:thiol-disulfide isomerase/thioredoxin
MDVLHPKRVRGGLVAALLAGSTAWAEAPIKPWTGTKLAPFELKELTGRTVGLSSKAGRVVLVNFWATWCEPCRDEMPSLERLKARLAGQPFDVLLVNYGESAARASDFASKLGLKSPVLLDPGKRTAESWNVKGLPMTFLVDTKGRVRYWAFGERDWSAGEGLRQVEVLIAEGSRAGR